MRELFLPDKVRLGRVLLLDEMVPNFMEVVLDSGLVHIEEDYEIFPLEVEFKYNLKDELSKIDLLESRIEAVCRILEVDPSSLRKGDLYDYVSEVSVVPSSISSRISSDLDKIEANISEVVSLIEKRKQFIFEKNQVSWFLSILLHSGLEYLYELNQDLVLVRLGSLPRQNLPLLKEALAEVPVSVEWARASRDRIMLLLISLPEHQGKIDSALKAGNFLSVDFESLNKTTHLTELIDDIEFAIWEAREEIGELTAMLRKKKEVFAKLLSRIVKLLLLEKKLVRALGMCKGSSYAVLVNMWVRENDVEDVESLLRSRLGAMVEVEWIEAEKVPLEREKIPTAFSLGRFWKDFFEIMRMYGYPSYAEVNPLVVFTVGFILMYGMMFADLGHGLVLALIGFLMRKKWDVIGRVMCWVGLSSAVWGIILGSVFGREDLITPLWISPLEDPIRLMTLSVLIGGSYISLGILISVVNKVRSRKVREALFGEWGITSLAFYLLSALALTLPVSTSVKFLLVGGGFAILLAGLTQVVHSKDELVSVPMETVLSLFSNTVSFVRLAAFAINHAALMIVVFVIADLVKSAHLSGLALILGNIFVIVLEAVLVAIQTLRLQFYEFFSKFYQGNGREFIPLRWDVTKV